MVCIKTKSRRYLNVSKRDKYGLNALDRVQLKEISICIPHLCDLYLIIKKSKRLKALCSPIKGSILKLFSEALKIVVVNDQNGDERIQNCRIEPYTFDSHQEFMNRSTATVSERFIFQSFDALRQFIR